MNNENLIPTTALTETQRRELASKGGKASVEAKRRKKMMKDWAIALGGIAADLKMMDGSTIEGDYAGLAVLAQYKKAIADGDTAAASFLAKLRGEDVIKVENVDDDEKMKALKAEMAALYGVTDAGETTGETTGNDEQD